MQRLSGFQNGLIAVYARILAAANTPGMATAVKPSRRPRTESCVVSGNGPCEA